MRKIKSVSFSEDEPFELDLFEFAMKQGKFSPYVKRLIQRDKEGSQPVKQVEEQTDGDFQSFL